MNQKGSAQILLPIVILGVITLSLTVSSNITTTSIPKPSQVLGENESAQKAEEQAKEAFQKAAEQVKEGIKVNTQSEGRKSETEIETSDGQKIKTKVEDDGKIKVEFESKNQKFKIESNDDKTKLELEDENETESSNSAEESLKEVRNITNFPLRIDANTNQLILVKNGVERVLAVLPAKAIQNMLAAHLKTDLGPKFFGDSTSSAAPSGEPSATESAGITILKDKVSLEEEDGKMVYKISAKKSLKVFGLIPVTTDLTSFVSAENGTLIKDEESLLSKFLDFLSP